jgi:hypothetical protein
MKDAQFTSFGAMHRIWREKRGGFAIIIITYLDSQQYLPLLD